MSGLPAVRSGEEVSHSHRLLIDAINSLSVDFSLYDQDERLVITNCDIVGKYGLPPHTQVLGMNYEALIRAIVAGGQVEISSGEEAQWITDRLDNYWKLKLPTITRFKSGQCQAMTYIRTPQGGTVCIREDVTDRLAMEAALRESEQRFQDFAASASDRFWETNQDHKYTYFSPTNPAPHNLARENCWGKPDGNLTRKIPWPRRWRNFVIFLKRIVLFVISVIPVLGKMALPCISASTANLSRMKKVISRAIGAPWWMKPPGSRRSKAGKRI